jgi:hypothetical protein
MRIYLASDEPVPLRVSQKRVMWWR